MLAIYSTCIIALSQNDIFLNKNLVYTEYQILQILQNTSFYDIKSLFLNKHYNFWIPCGSSIISITINVREYWKGNKLEAQHWAEPVSLTFHSALRKLNTEPSIGVFHQISAHFNQAVLEKMIFRDRPI